MKYHSAIKKNELMPSAVTWIGLEMIILSEVSQKKKDKYHMLSLICGTSEKAMAPHSSTLAWRISGMGEPGGLPSMGSHRVRHDWSDLAAAAAAAAYVEPKIRHKWTLMKLKLTHRHREQTCDCRACWGLREGWAESLGLADANYYT